MADKEVTVRAQIKEVVTGFIENETFEIKSKQISTNGANYLGDLYLIDVEQEGKETIKLFAKATNIPAEARAMIPANTVYKNEVLMYTDVANEFHALQEKHGLPEDKQFKFPKYYGSNVKELEEVVILENLAAQGYELFDRFKPLDWKYAKAALKEIAKFHALSFALKKESPEIFSKLSKIVKNQFFESPPDDGKQLLELARAKAQDIEDEKAKRSVMKYIDINEKEILVKYILPLTKYSVIIHGDYRASNILVKYKGEEIVSLKPIDYQTACYGNPVSDILYLLFTGTDEQFRKHYFEQFLEHYHNCLADHLKLLSQDINELYPKSAFYFEVKDRLLYGLDLGLLFLSTILVEPENKVEMGEMVNEEVLGEALMNLKASDACIERINGIVRDMMRWGVLPNVDDDTIENELTKEDVTANGEK